MSFSRKSYQLLSRLNFPPYTVHRLTERHFLVAGGGGCAKTGISNIIEIYELINDGSGCRAKSVIYYEAGSDAIMNGSIHDSGKYFIFFAGIEGLCMPYKIKFHLQDHEKVPNGVIKDRDHSTVLRSRKKHNSEQNNGKVHLMTDEKLAIAQNMSSMDLVCRVKKLDSFQTDFSSDPFQKLSRFCVPLKVLATGGVDGYIRLWKYPEMRHTYEVQAHQDDVDDLDFTPLGDKIVSVSRDGCGKVWNSKDLSFICELKYELPQKTDANYIFRSCRFAVVEENKENPVLFVTLNPRVRKKPPIQSYLSKWDGTTFSLQKIIPTGTEMISVMAVSEDGKFVAVGTQDGSVEIYIAFSLQLLYRSAKVHSIFVTGLEFLQSCENTRHITGGHEASLISISVDNHINIHYIQNRRKLSILSLIFMFIVALFFVFVLMDYFNL